MPHPKETWMSLRVPQKLKAEVTILAALKQKPIYSFVGEMLETWKAIHGIENLEGMLPEMTSLNDNPTFMVEEKE